jgi:TatA/E family protein of Tat protein translocase
MFGSIGMPELILIFVVALLVFGPKKLPELGKSLGRGLAEFKRASDDLKKTIEDEIEQGKHEANAVKKQVAEMRTTFDATSATATPPSDSAPAAPGGSASQPPAPQGPAPQGSVPRADAPIRPV